MGNLAIFFKIKFIFLVLLIGFLCDEDKIKKLQCRFLNTTDNQYINTCDYTDVIREINKCIDPSDTFLEETFAQSEFKWLNDVNLLNGVPDYESGFEHFYKFRHIIDEKNNIAEKTYSTCNFKDFSTDNLRSLCPWDEHLQYRDNLFPHLRIFAKCMQSCNQNCQNIKPQQLEKNNFTYFVHHKCTEQEKFELVVYRTEKCLNGFYIWDVGLEYVAHSCSCSKYETEFEN